MASRKPAPAAFAHLLRGRKARLRPGRRRCRGAITERRLVPAPGLAWALLAPRDPVVQGLFRLLDAGLVEVWLGDDGEFRCYPVEPTPSPRAARRGIRGAERPPAPSGRAGGGAEERRQTWNPTP